MTCDWVFNKFDGIVSTSPFSALSGIVDGMERLETFYTRRPHPASCVYKTFLNGQIFRHMLQNLQLHLKPLMIYWVFKTIEKLDLSRIPVINVVDPSGSNGF